MCYLMGVAELSVVVAVSTQDDNKLLRTTLAEVLILVPWCLRLLCFRPPLGRWQRSGQRARSGPWMLARDKLSSTLSITL